jgi:hypothetical protein
LYSRNGFVAKSAPRIAKLITKATKHPNPGENHPNPQKIAHIDTNPSACLPNLFQENSRQETSLIAIHRFRLARSLDPFRKT